VVGGRQRGRKEKPLVQKEKVPTGLNPGGGVVIAGWGAVTYKSRERNDSAYDGESSKKDKGGGSHDGGREKGKAQRYNNKRSVGGRRGELNGGEQMRYVSYTAHQKKKTS